MLDTTRDAVKAMLRADSSLKASERKRILAILQNGSMAEDVHNDRIVRRAEAATILGRSTRAVDRLAATGIIRRVRFPRYRRAAGFSAHDLFALIESYGIGSKRR